MTCDDYLILIYEKVDGEISIANAALLDSHLTQCGACGSVYESVCQADLFFKRIVPAVAQNGADLASRLYEESSKAQLRSRELVAATLAGWVAASIAVIAVGRWSVAALPALEHLFTTPAVDALHFLSSTFQWRIALPEVDLAAATIAAVALLQILGSYLLTRSEQI